QTFQMIVYTFTFDSDLLSFSRFLLNDTSTPEIYTLSLHDALPIFGTYLESHEGEHMSRKQKISEVDAEKMRQQAVDLGHVLSEQDRKSTRLNSSHVKISYAVFCLKKKKKKKKY